MPTAPAIESVADSPYSIPTKSSKDKGSEALTSRPRTGSIRTFRLRGAGLSAYDVHGARPSPPAPGRCQRRRSEHRLQQVVVGVRERRLLLHRHVLHAVGGEGEYG